MATTKAIKVEFGRRINSYQTATKNLNTRGCSLKKTGVIKVYRRVGDNALSSSVYKIDVSEQKRRATYRRINKRLGGV